METFTKVFGSDWDYMVLSEASEELDPDGFILPNSSEYDLSSITFINTFS